MDLESYISSHIGKEPDCLHAIDRQTNLKLLNGRMCSGHLQGRILKMLTTMIAPHKALELGTFSGYSALCIAEGLPPDATLDTVEADDELEDTIIRNLSFSPDGAKVRLHIADALQFMAGRHDGEYGLIFIDADKRLYPEYYEEAMRLLKPGGYILADNTLWSGHVLDDDRRSPQTDGVKAFNDTVASDPRVETVILPLRDGLTLIRKLTDANDCTAGNVIR